MLNIKRFMCGPLQENTYVVSDETQECIIVDCGAIYPEEQQAIKDYISKNQLIPKHLIATHGHFDHNLGNDFILKEYGLKVELSERDEDQIEQLQTQAMAVAGIQIDAQSAPIGKFLSESDTISFGSHTFTIIATPGHTPGGVFYYCEAEHVAFSGDTLFHNSVGRTDLMGGSMFMLIQSLRQISQMPDETIILPGHGPETTIGKEEESNPYMDR